MVASVKRPRGDILMIVPDGQPPKKYSSHNVVRACEAVFDDWCDDCSGFVKAVLTELSMQNVASLFPNVGQANDIVDAFESSPWTKIKSGALAATMSERQNRIILAGCKDTDNGHVVVVVPGPLNRGRYPTAYWGSLNQPEQSAKYQTINWAWEVGGDQIDKVVYAYAERLHGGASGSW